MQNDTKCIYLTLEDIKEVSSLIISKYDKLLNKKNNLYILSLTDKVNDYNVRFKALSTQCDFYNDLIKKFLI